MTTTTETPDKIKGENRAPWVPVERLVSDFYSPTLQTKYNEDGNCLAAVIATLFDILIDDIPFFDDENWVLDLSKWMSCKTGKFIMPVKLEDKAGHEVFCGSLMMTCINSDNPKVDRHVVISKNGRIVFDPMVGDLDIPILKRMEPTFLIVSDVRGFTR